MSKNSGKTTKRIVVEEDYKGFDIIKVKVTKYWLYAGYYRSTIDKIETYFTFCAHGNSNRPSMEYDTRADTLSEIKEKIDNFIKDDCLYFTEAERNKYVYNPNSKNGWGFSYDDLIKLMNAHKRADKRIKRLYEDRLEDANFHGYCGYLAEGRYDDYIALAKSEYPTQFKVSISHLTDKQIELVNNGIVGAINAYLESVGIKGNGVEVDVLK